MSLWRAIRMAFLVASAFAVAMGVAPWLPAAPRRNLDDERNPVPLSPAQPDPAAPFHAALDQLVDSALFLEASTSEADVVAANDPVVAPTQPLLLSGVIIGRTKVAVLSGIPGVDGARAVHEGESVAGILLREVRADYVVVRNADSTWRIRIETPGEVR